MAYPCGIPLPTSRLHKSNGNINIYMKTIHLHAMEGKQYDYEYNMGKG